MRIFKALISALALLALQQTGAAAEGTTQVPDSCPVTRSTPETRFTPSLPAHAPASGETMFWYGSDSLYTSLFSDGRSRGARHRSFWYRKNADWLNEDPYQLVVTAKQFNAAGPLLTFPRVTNAIMGKEVAMLLMLELPKPGCWQVTANYKDDYVSFVTWVD